MQVSPFVIAHALPDMVLCTHLAVFLQVEKWLKRAFLPGMRTFKPDTVAIAITSPGAHMAKPNN